MKVTCTVEIDAPLKQVVELFDNPDNLGEWQENLQSITQLRGTQGEEGAESLLVFEEQSFRSNR